MTNCPSLSIPMLRGSEPTAKPLLGALQEELAGLSISFGLWLQNLSYKLGFEERNEFCAVILQSPWVPRIVQSKIPVVKCILLSPLSYGVTLRLQVGCWNQSVMLPLFL